MFKLYKYFYKKSPTFLILAGGFFPLLTSIVSSYTKDFFILEDTSTDFLEEYSSVFFIINVVFLCPLVETLLIQFLPLKLLNTYLKKHKYLYSITAIGVLSLIFASLHPLEPFYFISAFFMGLFWGFFCFILIRKQQHPYIYTSIMHMIYNGVLVNGGNIFYLIIQQ